MPKKISRDAFYKLVADPEIRDEDLRPYLLAAPTGGRPFEPNIILNPETVDIPADIAEFENAMKIGNGIARARRRRTFKHRLQRRPDMPIVVAEGDSWWQFPFLITDVIDHVSEYFNVFSLGAAGDTASNMVAQKEYVAPLVEYRSRVQAFLFSAAGNDVIGADASGTPQLLKLVHKMRDGASAAELIKKRALKETIEKLFAYYKEAISDIRAQAGLSSLPIIIHGYDYAIPGSKTDPRNPLWAKPDQWLGGPLAEKRIINPGLQREVIKLLIDELYEMLFSLTDYDDDVYVVDVRGVLPERSDWADEIHGTDEGFRRVADKFLNVLGDTTSLRSAHRTTLSLEGSGRAAPIETRSLVVIDPGHGGETAIGGSSANNATGPTGLKEKTVTLAVAKRAAEILEKRGVDVRLTRETDENLSLADRAAVARENAAAVFLSIHFNGWSDPSVQGTETYHHQSATQRSKSLAADIQRQLLQATQLRDRGVKSASFGVLRPNRHGEGTAACLAEVSFLTAPAEEARLRDEDYLNRIAEGLANGVEAYLQGAAGAVLETTLLESVASLEVEDATALMAGVQSSGAPMSGPMFAPDFPSSDDIDDIQIEGLENPARFLAKWRSIQRGDAALETQFEAVIGRDDKLPFSFLVRGHEAGRAVCKIETSGRNHEGIFLDNWAGSGFLISKDILLTNHHVLNSPEVARNASVRFGYHAVEGGRLNSGESYQLDPDSLFITSRARGGLDFTFVRVVGAPGEKFGFIPAERASFTISQNERANIIQHPNGEPKQVTLQDNRMIGKFHPQLLHYTSDTERGSSGSPVFDNTWRLIALHHAAKRLADSEKIANEGVKISAIAVDLENRLQDPSQARSARTALAAIRGSDSLTGFFGAVGRHRGGGNAYEAVVNAYKGGAQDIDVAFWNLEWFNRPNHGRIETVAKVIADLNLDIWAFSETSPDATEALVDHLSNHYGHRFEFAASEPHASSGKQPTTVIWNPLTVEGKSVPWPDDIDAMFKADSREFGELGLEAVEGRIFNRYPGLFRFAVKGRDKNGRAPFDFNLVPLHLKAKAEGAKRRRMASKILAFAVEEMIDRHGSDRDWLIGGDINAELATGQFSALTDSGFAALSAEDEEAGAMSYLKRPRSLIDSIFLSPNLTQRYGFKDFFIYAGDQAIPDYVETISDHRPVMVRLGLSDEEKSDAPDQSGLDRRKDKKKKSRDTSSVEDLVERFLDRARSDPEALFDEFAKQLCSDK